MVFCRASEKVAGGKLVRLELEHDGSRITRAKITGDFFMHPEDAIGEIEAAMLVININESEPEITSKLSSIITSKSVEMVGFSPEVLAKLVRVAIETGEQK